MKFIAVIAAALLLVIPGARAQENPDDQYVIIYVQIQQGDASVNSGQTKQALADYVEAQRELQKFQQVYSDWNPEIVKFRLKYLADRIEALTPETPATNIPPANVPPPTPADWQAQLASLNGQIQRLQGDNQTLNSKLKEALSAQPAAVSADAYSQMQQQVSELSKENELLKATVAQATNVPPTATPENNRQLQLALAAATAQITQLTLQNQSLKVQMQSLTTDANDLAALRQENALLKKKLASIGSTPSAPAATGAGDLAMARAQIAQLQSEETADALEKAALENRIQQMQEASVSSTAVADASAQSDLQSRVNELTLERDNLLAQLGEANKKLYGRKNQSAAAQIEVLSQQVEALRARVEVDEAQTIPFTPQELALFTPEPVAANPNAEKKSIHDLPRGSAVLVAEAERHFANREYDMAAADYQKILQHDENNPLALANLAAIEVEENKTADADKHIQAALAQAPNDPFNLTVLGRVKFTEGKYDAAFDALSRAAKLDPQNPQIQNFLGVALAQKGLRVQAETAFRKAVQLSPDYGDAHKNLAIIYLSASPPAVELARWHYEKALAAGVPPNPDLEEMLNRNDDANSQK